MLHMKSIGIIIYYAKVNLFENKNFDNCSTEIIFASRYCIIRVFDKKLTFIINAIFTYEK